MGHRKKKEYRYEYPFSKARLLEELNSTKGIYYDRILGEYLIEIKSEDRFFLGVERCGHNSGFWYVADLEETDGQTLTVSGKIVYQPDEEGNERISVLSAKEKMGLALGYLFLFPVKLFFDLVINPVYLLILAIGRKPLTKAQKLDGFMIEYLHCKKI